MSKEGRLILLSAARRLIQAVKTHRTSALAMWCCIAMLMTPPWAQAERTDVNRETRSTSSEEPPAQWRELTNVQKQVLAPLAPQWSEMDDTARGKWLNLANRYKSLSPREQARMRERMAQWSQLHPQERGEARLRFQQSRRLSPQERQRKWQAYQSLPAEQREALGRRALRQSKPVELPLDMTGPREASQLLATQQGRHAGQSHRKSNMVERSQTVVRPTPKVLAPAVIKAGTGATTRLLTQPPTPPAHQQAGLPKISSVGPFVDPVTLLPRKGAQGAGITPPAPPAAAR